MCRFEVRNVSYDLKKVRISYEIEDLFDEENNPNGTRVNINILKEKTKTR